MVRQILAALDTTTITRMSISSSALWTISTGVGMIIGVLTFGKFMDRFGSKRAFGIFLLASACAMFLMLLYNWSCRGINR
ncbi:hypothetical protein D3C81_1944570 [compost metagenome]